MDNLPIVNVDLGSEDNQSALLRRCMMTDEENIRPVVDEMRLNLDDEEMKQWLGRLFGALANGTVDVS